MIRVLRNPFCGQQAINIYRNDPGLKDFGGITEETDLITITPFSGQDSGWTLY